MKPPLSTPIQSSTKGAAAASRAGMRAARMPRDQHSTPQAWHSDRHGGNFASSANAYRLHAGQPTPPEK